MQYLTNKGTIQETQRVSYIPGSNMASKKPEINFLLTASTVIQDKFTNKWSYIDIFTNIVILKGQEYSYQSFVVAGRINNLPGGNSSAIVRIVAPDGSVFEERNATGNFLEGDAGLAMRFILVKFVKPGRYYIQFFTDGVKLKDDNKYFIDVTKES